MKLAVYGSTFVCLAVMGCASSPDQPAPAAMTELAPAGKLRFGIAVAPEQSTFFVDKDAQGEPHGVTVDLANHLGRSIGRPVEFLMAPNTGILTDALTNGTLDVAFMPVDDERRQKLAIGPVYFVGQNTYLVRAGSDIRTIAEVDRPGVRVIGIANTTTIRGAAMTLTKTKIEPAESVDVALEMMRSGNADAFALTRDTLLSMAQKVPGSRVLDGAFREVSIAIVVPKGRPGALAYVSKWLESAKASGLVRKAFDDSGFTKAEVAPPSPR
jgi:polar amino acid transport system substrate-binding protein